MGMYTALALGVELRKDLPDSVTEILSYMVTGDGARPPLPAGAGAYHPLFSCWRWDFMLRCDSYYFDWQTHWSFEFNEISDAYYLSGVSNLKNYEGEIGHFLNWLAPYIDPSIYGSIGWTQYEEEMYPTIITRKEDTGLHLTNVAQLFRDLDTAEEMLTALGTYTPESRIGNWANNRQKDPMK